MEALDVSINTLLLGEFVCVAFKVSFFIATIFSQGVYQVLGNFSDV